MAGDAAQGEAEIDPLFHAAAGFDLHGFEADIVGVFQGGDGVAAVEGDVELARQAVQVAVVQDVVVQFPAQGEHVVEFVGVDAAGGVAGDVADVVRAGTARNDAGLMQVGEQRGHVRAGDLADLQVGAGGHVDVAAAVGLGRVGDGQGLVGLEDAAGDAQAAHHGFLGRGNVPQAVGLEAEDVLACGQLALGGKFGDAGPGVERIRVELDLLFLREALARGEPVQLGLLAGRDLDSFNGRCGGRRGGRRGRLAAQGAEEPFEVFLLAVGEWLSVRRYQLCYSRRV